MAKVAPDFRDALVTLEDGNRVYGKQDGQSLVGMFDDIMSAWERDLARMFETEDTLRVVLQKWKGGQAMYKKEKRDATLAKDELQGLKRDARATAKKLEVGRAQIVALESELRDKEDDIDNLQEAIELCRDVIFDKDDFELPPDTKKTLIRVCSRSTSLRTQKKRALNRVEETLESLENDSQYQASFDDTGDLLDLPPRPKARRSGNHRQSVEKQLEEDYSSNALDMSISRCVPPTTKKRPSQRLRRKSAEIESTKQDTPDSFWAVQTPMKMKLDKPTRPNTDQNRPLPQLSNQPSSSPNINRHTWVKKRMLSMIAPNCSYCNKKCSISTFAWKCNNNCGVILHEDCKSKYNRPCSSTTVSMTRRPLIEFITSNQSPRIPACLYMAIHEVDARLHEEGIYRINGSTIEVQRLRKCFANGEVTHDMLKQIVDTNTICSTIKDFYRNQLCEPILTYRLMPQFIQAYENNDLNLTKELFLELPSENKDTLGFLLIHFKNVILKSQFNRMTHEALSKSVGPSIVGFVTETPDATEMLQASKYQEGVMSLLLKLPHKFYNSIIAESETTTEGTMSSLTTVSNGESLDAFGDQNATCVEQKRKLFHPPQSPSKNFRRTQVIDPSTPFKDNRRLFK